MANIIEASKSNRATCRTCKEKIDKAVLRFGDEIPNQFDPDGGSAYVWHHLACAAARMPQKVKEALAAFGGVVPEREKLEAILAAPPKASVAKGGPKASYPYAELAATGRSKCMHCDEPIEKGTYRVAVEREVDTGTFSSTGPGYLHPACAVEYTGDVELLPKIQTNSVGLTPEGLARLAEAFA